jgi:uncharacterized membrane protein YccF (DUF307 family)
MTGHHLPRLLGCGLVRFFRGLAWLYAAVVACALVFALPVDVAMRSFAMEHMHEE